MLSDKQNQEPSMAGNDDDPIPFSVRKGADPKLVDERTKTPDGKSHPNLFDAILYWWRAHPSDRGKRIKISEATMPRGPKG